MIVQENKSFAPCPEYSGIAKIVDTTELREYKTDFGNKMCFRYILEINQKDSKGKYQTVASRPFTLSMHEKAALRDFVKKVKGSVPTGTSGFDTDSLVGQYCSVIVEHVQSGDKTFANLTYVGKAKENTTWQSAYVRFADRPPKTEAVEVGDETLTSEQEAEIAAGAAKDPTAGDEFKTFFKS